MISPLPQSVSYDRWEGEADSNSMMFHFPIRLTQDFSPKDKEYYKRSQSCK